MIGTHSAKSKLKLNHPVYIGQATLDFSKHLLYNDVTTQYGSRLQMCYTDTDSLVYQVETPDVYKDMPNHLHDFSDYHKDQPATRRKTQKFNDESCSKVITDFAGLRPEMYSILKADESEFRKAKGATGSWSIENRGTSGTNRPCSSARRYGTHRYSRNHQIRVSEQNEVNHQITLSQLNKVNHKTSVSDHNKLNTVIVNKANIFCT